MVRCGAATVRPTDEEGPNSLFGASTCTLHGGINQRWTRILKFPPRKAKATCATMATAYFDDLIVAAINGRQGGWLVDVIATHSS